MIETAELRQGPRGLARTLYLHIGSGKTGTSALQDILGRHDNSVVIYPKAGRSKHGSHHNLVFNFFQEHARLDVIREDADLLLARIAEEARQSQRDLVISSEALAGQRDLNDFVSALLRHLAPESFRVELVVVVREHFERAASAYNQRVKGAETRERRDPDKFLAEQTPALGYAGWLRRLAKTGFDIAVLNYHPAGDCVARVLGHFGFSPGQIGDAPRLNPSLSRKALIAVLAANRVAPSIPDRNAIFSALRQMPGFYGPSRPVFGAEAAVEAERKFAQDRNFLRKQFGVAFPAPNLARIGNAFVVDGPELSEIADATSELGDLGAAVREEVSRYLRHAAVEAVEKPAL
jgi:hypothetical protein